MSLLVPPVGVLAGSYIEPVPEVFFTNALAANITFLGVPFGAPHADRTVIVSLASATGGATTKTFTSAEIDGSAATTLVTQSYDGANQSVTAIFARTLAAGSSGTVRVIYSGNVQFHALKVFRAIGVSLTATDTATASGATTSHTLDLNTLAGNCVIAAVTRQDSGGGATWSGVLEAGEVLTASTTQGQALLQRAATAETPRSVSVSGSSADGAACAVSLPFN